MKKLSKVFGMIACAFVIVLSGVILTACGGAKPYSVKGVTLQGTEKCSIVWNDDATQQDKDDLWSIVNATNDEEFEQKYSEDLGEFYKSFTFAFNSDGTVTVTRNETQTLYYTQTEDLKTIAVYKNVEHTNSYCKLEFYDGEFAMAEYTDYNATIYFSLKRI